MSKIAIIGGGLSGLTTAFYLKQYLTKQSEELEITIFENSSRVGGKIWSIQEQGYLCEYGPNGFLDNKPDTLELCSLLGISDLLVKSNDNARKRFIVDEGNLFKLPHSPLEFLKSDIISLHGKLRMLGELFISNNSTDIDESVANFVSRRLGQEALDKLITPMSKGIYAGNPEKMSLGACFPRIKQLEDNYGGLFKGMFAIAKNKSKLSASAIGPGGILTSFANGIEFLTNSLAEHVGLENIYIDSCITQITQQDNLEYKLNIHKNGDKFTAKYDCVIVATPAYSAADLLSNLNHNLAILLRRIIYSPLVVVCLGYDLNDIKHDTNGFGYLFTENNRNKKILGTLWESSIFINRAPNNKILFRSMLGGGKHMDINSYSDSVLVNMTMRSLRNVLGVTTNYDFMKIIRHENAIPQYNIGHIKLLELINQQVNKHKNLYLIGNAYQGIGINDCIHNAKMLASKIALSLQK